MQCGKRAGLEDGMGVAEEGSAHTHLHQSLFELEVSRRSRWGFRAGCGWVFERGVVCGALQIPQLKWSEAD
jgi:hypothetical protein